MGKTPTRRKYVRNPAPVYNIIVNPSAADFSESKIELLKQAILDSRGRFFINYPESIGEAQYQVKRIINKRPHGVIVCGGDGTVSQIARSLIRRTIGLGIYPMGRFNNIYRSLYGEPDPDEAISHILSRRFRKLDYALAAKHFFIGSLSIGLIPAMSELLNNKRTPRFGIGWSRLAALAAADINLVETSIKVDAFGFNLTPQTISVNLLSHSLGLPFTTASIPDDGKYEISFDIGPEQAIMSSYIRHIFKKKYIYSDEIRMFRGEKVAINPMKNRVVYLDGELHRIDQPELLIEIFPQRIRYFHKIGAKN